MIGQFKGDIVLNGISYVFQYTGSATATRIDMYTIENATTDGFFVMNPENVHVACSIFLKGDDTYYYGDYSLYQKYIKLVNTAKYYYYQGNEVKEDKVDYTAQGICQTYYALSRDGNTEIQTEQLNGDYKSLMYRCGNSMLTMTLHKAKPSCNMLSKLTYEKKEYEDYFEVKGVSTYRSLNEIGTFKDIKWLEDKKDKYFVVDTIEEFDKLIKQLKDSVRKGRYIGFDTETTGTCFNRLPRGTANRDELVGICITDRIGYGWYIPVGHISIDNIPLDYCLQEIRWILTEGKLVTHYGKFDWQVMHSYGIDINIVHDTYILLYMLSQADAHNNLKLKHATEVYLHFDQIELSDIFPGGEEGGVQFQILPKKIVWAYAPTDADTTLSLFNILRDKLPEASRTLYHHEVYFMTVLALMEYEGNAIDMDKMEIEADKCLHDIQTLERVLYETVGYTFNPNSPVMLNKLLYEDLKCEVLTTTNTGAPSTGAVALKNLAKKALDKPVNTFKDVVSDYTEVNGQPKVLLDAKTLNYAKYPVIHILLKYKKLIKLYSTYFVGIKRDNQEGWLFSSYNQTRAATGRTISNFQQIPAALKHLVVPWGPDYYMVNVDYKSIELYVMVGVAGQEDVIKQFSNPESDAHRIIGSKLLKKPPQEISTPERKDMKVANFGVPYDMGPHSLAQYLRGFPVTKENVLYAKQLKADYLNSMPKVKKMFEVVRDRAQKEGLVTTKFGRMGRFPNLVKETDPSLIARGRRQAGNLPIQGTAADILKMATNRLFKAIKDSGLDIHITGSIHDELILIVNKSIHPFQVIKMIKEAMELKIKDFPTLFTGISVSHNWGEGHGLDILEIPQYLAQDCVRRFDEGDLPDVGDDPRDYMLDLIRQYLRMRFDSYLVELGLNREHPEQSDFYKLVTEFKHMYLGPRCVAYYTDFGGVKGEPKLKEAVKHAIADCLGWTVEKVEDYIKRDTPAESTSIEDIEVNVKLDDFAFSEYDDIEFNDSEEDTGEITLAGADEDDDAESFNNKPVEVSEDMFKILSTADAVIIDLKDSTRETVTQLTAYFETLHRPGGFQNVMYKLGKDLIQTKIYIDEFDRDIVMDILNSTKLEPLKS